MPAILTPRLEVSAVVPEVSVELSLRLVEGATPKSICAHRWALLFPRGSCMGHGHLCIRRWYLMWTKHKIYFVALENYMQSKVSVDDEGMIRGCHGWVDGRHKISQ